MSLDDLHSLSDFEYPQEQAPAAPPPKKPRKPEKAKKAEKKADKKAEKEKPSKDSGKPGNKERAGLFGRKKHEEPAPEIESPVEVAPEIAVAVAAPEAAPEVAVSVPEIAPEVAPVVESEPEMPAVEEAREPTFVRQPIYLDDIPPLVEAPPEPLAPRVPEPRPARSAPPTAEPAVPWYQTKGWRIAGKVGGFLLALLWLVLISGTLIMRTFGYEPLVVQTQSMEPTVDAGDLMISTTRTEPVQVGQIYIGIAPNTGLPTAHRVTGPGPDPDCWITKGDNNDAVDPYCLTTAELSKKIVGWIPYGGFVNNFLSQPLVRMLMFVAPLLLFLPPIIRAFRTQKMPASETESDEDTGEGSDESAEDEPVGLRIGAVDKVVSLLVALAIFGILGARLYYGFVPVAVGDVQPESSLAGGAMAITQPRPIGDLVPGDVILIVPPEQTLASLQSVVVQEQDPTLLPPEPGNVYISTVDAAAPAGSTINRMQFQAAAEVPTVVFEVPRLGALLPVLATTAGFAGIMILMGLFGTILVMRVLLSTGNTRTRKRPAGNVA